MRHPEEAAIARLVLDRLNRRGMSLAQACRVSGVDYSTIGHWLRGHRSVSLRHLAPLLASLNLRTVPEEELHDYPRFARTPQRLRRLGYP